MDPKIQVLSSANPSDVRETCSTSALTESEFTRLRDAASKAKEGAYCPYSRFRVGAALLVGATGRGTGAAEAGEAEIVTGANIENASYPVGTCAERVAFGNAITAGHRRFRAVAVSTDLERACSPCGMCRQFIREFCDLTVPVIMFDKNGNYVVLTMQELLPLSFGPDALNVQTSV